MSLPRRGSAVSNPKSILCTKAWVAPSFSTDPSQRIVTFKFPGENGAGRSCLLSILMRFEYFQKALESWQESASAEIIVTDATTETFDLFLAYLHSGEVDSTLGLEGLLGLFELGNKYLLSHLVAICMAQILRSLAALLWLGWVSEKEQVENTSKHIRDHGSINTKRLSHPT